MINVAGKANEAIELIDMTAKAEVPTDIANFFSRTKNKGESLLYLFFIIVYTLYILLNISFIVILLIYPLAELN